MGREGVDCERRTCDRRTVAAEEERPGFWDGGHGDKPPAVSIIYAAQRHRHSNIAATVPFSASLTVTVGLILGLVRICAGVERLSSPFLVLQPPLSRPLSLGEESKDRFKTELTRLVSLLAQP